MDFNKLIAEVKALLVNLDPATVAKVEAAIAKLTADIIAKNVLGAFVDGFALFQLVMSLLPKADQIKVAAACPGLSLPVSAVA
jgi:hypothetical protein